MNTTSVDSIQSTSAQKAVAYGGLLDSLGGIAVVALAIVGLTGFDPPGMAGIAAVVLGAALLVQGGTILSEYASILSMSGASFTSSVSRAAAERLSCVFLVGAGGIVLGVLALLGIASEVLLSVAVIAFGSALALSSGALRKLSMPEVETPALARSRAVSEMFGELMTAGAAGMQLVAGLAGLVLGILAVAGENGMILTLVALLVLGVTVLFTGSTLSGLVLSFMRSSHGGGERFGVGG